MECSSKKFLREVSQSYGPSSNSYSHTMNSMKPHFGGGQTMDRGRRGLYIIVRGRDCRCAVATIGISQFHKICASVSF